MTAQEDGQILRLGHYADKVVFVDGQPGCGKTLFSPVVATLERAELLTYAYEIEYVCALRFLDKMTMDAALTMARMLTDLQLYNTMMGRGVNVRPTDMSGVLRDARPWRYVRRLFMKGDECVPARIAAEKPILNLTTHNLLGIADPIFEGLDKRAVFVEIVRHPLYMVKQQGLNMERILEDRRDFTIYFRKGGRQLPFWARGWEDAYLGSNDMEKTIYAIDALTRLTEGKKKMFREKYQASIVTIPFEPFVLGPETYMEQMTAAIGTAATPATARMLKKQNVPRKRIADGIALPIYKRCGWTPPQGDSEEKDLELRWDMAAQSASKEALRVLDAVCTAYEERYLGGRKDYIRKGL